ncbi:MAG: trimethylamine methyltransferase family protein [Candidatus Bipolaricaulota bacterium]|nr:MAG: trimethylamine methyltransferase family protein [Candidatus Bipolaricaulota bacterium]
MRFRPTLKVLSDEQIDRIHQSALEMLGNPGVLVKSDEARRLLKQAGATVDEETMICRIPGDIVEEAMNSAPAAFTVHARNPENDVHVSTTDVHIEPMIGRINCYDYASGEARPTNLKDVGELVRIADAMPNYHLLHSGAIMPQIEGIPIRATHAHGYLESVRNSTKPVKATSRERIMAEDCLRMVSVVAGGDEELKRRPCTFTTDNPVAPLHHDRDQMEGALLYAQYGIPIDVTSEPQAGATSPVTIAGLLAQQTADVISGITIIQLKNPGNPVWYGTCGSVMDMRVGRIAIGAVEMGLINVASAQMAHFYDVPCRGTASATDSKELDFQAGYEKTAVLTMAVLGGVNKIFYPGTMEGALTVSKESLVLDDEIAGAIYRVLEGVDVVDDTLGVQLARTVGPGGHYLNQRHTMQFIRQEHFMPLLADRLIRERWEEAGRKTMVAKAHETVARILAEHEVEPLPEGTEEEQKRIVHEIEERDESRA